ncbi:hypothetical protein HMN09_00555100 [Mycena chlorophos]|uniref:Uncharacterized protein n=1 Tax=Mycena chlorophos TaxID=658473 RepID=A0A8H6WET6_MYCCL|nr:hypothetical protein HMN09_00555100 [Mycena chlorophos]
MDVVVSVDQLELLRLVLGFILGVHVCFELLAVTVAVEFVAVEFVEVAIVVAIIFCIRVLFVRLAFFLVRLAFLLILVAFLKRLFTFRLLLAPLIQLERVVHRISFPFAVVSIKLRPSELHPHVGFHCNLATATSSSSRSGSLSATAAADNDFAHNVGGIVGVAIGGLIAVVVGVLIMFFACAWYRRRRKSRIAPPPPMREAGIPTRRSPLGDADSLHDSENASESLGHVSSGQMHMAFSEAGAALASGSNEPGMRYAPGTTATPSSHGHSSNSHGHSNTSQRGLLPSSESGHGHEERSPPTSYTYHDNRSGGSSKNNSPRPPPPARSSLLNPPVPTAVDRTPPAVLPPTWSSSGWMSPPGPGSPAEETEERQPPATEGLLRPGLLLPTLSSRTLGDDIDYSRPLANRPLNVRMDTSDTYASNMSSNGHDDDEAAPMRVT